jgi:hypothetical protein
MSAIAPVSTAPGSAGSRPFLLERVQPAITVGGAIIAILSVALGVAVGG